MQNMSVSSASSAAACANIVFTRARWFVQTGLAFPVLPEVKRIVSMSSQRASDRSTFSVGGERFSVSVRSGRIFTGSSKRRSVSRYSPSATITSISAACTQCSISSFVYPVQSGSRTAPSFHTAQKHKNAAGWSFAQTPTWAPLPTPCAHNRSAAHSLYSSNSR